ncbi:dynamin family protein [Devriesea agamarum]|uniref:dynamin family protein n=1 Tax=Devriesea agamarum TaxID=472569 RepID=UPI000A047F22
MDTQDPLVPRTVSPTGVPGAGAGSEEALLTRLCDQLSGVRLPLPVPGADQARDEIAAVSGQLADHVLPRIRSLSAPLLAVVGGSTGAGKSTLVNSLIGRRVTRAGAIRPTTRTPILVHHPEDAPWFEGSRILPGLARIRRDQADQGGQGSTGRAGRLGSGAGGDAAGPGGLELVADPAVPRGLALLDAPDVDSVSEANRRLAGQLLRAADLWIFVTTANRYADAVPWVLLDQAADRDITVAIVMNRIPAPFATATNSQLGTGWASGTPAESPDTLSAETSSASAEAGIDDAVTAELLEDLSALLVRRGLEPAALFPVREMPLDHDGLVSRAAIEPLDTWMRELAHDAGRRAELARRTLAGALQAVAAGTQRIAVATQDQATALQARRAEVSSAFKTAHDHIVEAVSDGSLLRGEVLARWQDLVGAGEFFRGVEAWFSRMRDRAGAFLRGKPAPAIRVEQALETGLRSVVIEELARACERVDSAWRADPSGRLLLNGDDMARLPNSTGDDVARAIRDWQADVLELVSTEGRDRRQRARILSLGVNVVGIALMVVVFASTAFIPTGLEVGVGAGTAVIGQKLLETIFGDEAVRRLARTARDQLEDRLRALGAARMEDFTARIDAVDLGPSPESLREAVEEVRALAHEVAAPRQAGDLS